MLGSDSSSNLSRSKLTSASLTWSRRSGDTGSRMRSIRAAWPTSRRVPWLGWSWRASSALSSRESSSSSPFTCALPNSSTPLCSFSSIRCPPSSLMRLSKMVPEDHKRRGLGRSAKRVVAALAMEAVSSGRNPRGSSATSRTMSALSMPPPALSVSMRSTWGGDTSS